MDETSLTQMDSVVSSSRTPFAKRAAIWSFWCPFVTCIAFATLVLVSQLGSGDVVYQIRRGVLGVSCLAAIAGFVLGWIGLFGIRAHGKQGIVWPALIGVILNGVIVVAGCIAIYAIVEIRRDSQSAQSQDEARFMATLGQMQNGRRLLYDIARNETGDAALAAEALSKILNKEEILLESYYAKTKPLMTMHVLDVSGIETVDALQKRRKMVQQFMEANILLSTFCQDIEADYRTEMQNRGVSPAVIEKQSKAVRMMPEAQPLLDRIWKANVEWSHLELKALDFLQTHWGDWEYDAPLKQTRFTDKSLIEEFNKLAGEINRVDQERKQLKQNLRVTVAF